MTFLMYSYSDDEIDELIGEKEELEEELLELARAVNSRRVEEILQRLEEIEDELSEN
jgi:hypothetical protein